MAPPSSTPSGLPNPTPQTPPQDGFKPIPQPDPQPQPQPTPPQTDICESPCIQSMGQKINQSSIFWVEVQVPIVICEFKDDVWTPKRDSKTVKIIATQAGNEILKTQTEFNELAKANEEICNLKNKYPQDEAYLVTPEWWQVRVFQRPQLVIQYAQLLPDNKIGRSRWAVTIPHYNKPKEYKPKFPQYDKGNFEGILVLKDNSKIIINAKSKPECTRVLENFKLFINPVYLKDIQLPKIGERPGVYKEVSVVHVYAHFFKDGQKDNVPTWSIKLRDKK
ncbi:MAG: hypothetical protein V7K18_25105 [Nostoc sp.]|uniref:hypothetical protein n=1 Tax=Nostoc sp. TaxID=1180 RepID=UPI002FFB30AF